MSFSTLLSLIDDLVPDTGGRLKPGSTERAIERARVRYSEDRPRRLLKDVTAATAGQVVDVPAEWEVDFSGLLGIEYPVGSVPPIELRPSAFSVLSTPAGDAIGLLESVPAGAVLWVTFSASHLLDATHCTVPEPHLEAVACWAAALLADQLAAAYADNTDPTIEADRVDFTSPSRTWAARAKAYRERYAQLVGVKGMAPGDRPAVQSACAETDLDISPSDGGSWYRGRRRG